MSRLTRRDKEGHLIMPMFSDGIGLCLDKLAHYEDLEEQGKLIELPCKVGTPIYYVTSYIDNKTYDFKYHIVKVGFKVAYLANFGKTVFITKEEAEAKLAELKGGKADGN